METGFHHAFEIEEELLEDKRKKDEKRYNQDRIDIIALEKKEDRW